jgi:hypothetical protein
VALVMGDSIRHFLVARLGSRQECLSGAQEAGQAEREVALARPRAAADQDHLPAFY